MSVIARFTIPADQFVLGEVLEVRRGVRIRLESTIPTGDSTIPYVWVSSQDADDVETALRQSSLVEDVRRVEETPSETLFRLHWSAEVNGLVDVIDASDAVILEGEGRGDDWSFRLRFPTHRHLSEFYRTCVDGGLTPELVEVNESLGSTADTTLRLTEAQREALQKALDAGYFDVPRRVTLEELAKEFGISDTALSQRLRRGLTSLLSSTLLQSGDPADDERPD